MGQLSDARKMRQSALEIAKSLADGRTKVLALREVAYAQAEGENRASALETLRQAAQAAMAIQDQNEQGSALFNLVLVYMPLDDYEGALRTAASMKEDS